MLFGVAAIKSLLFFVYNSNLGFANGHVFCVLKLGSDMLELLVDIIELAG